VSWTEQAACRRADPALFFPSHNSDTHAAVAAAKVLCAGCSVRASCLAEAMKLGVVHGVRGGMTPKERRAYARTNKENSDE
jgi:WhiB family redox-sensing transcriptional regulator